MKSLDELHKKYQLSPSQIDIISKLIISNLTQGITSVDNPHAIILGGQPGAGKGELITEAQNLLGKNLVTCNADDYRDQHPKATEIKQLHEADYPEITAKYAQEWNNRLREYCEENSFNYILETTFSSESVMNDTIRKIQAKGFDVSIMLLAVNHHLSFLGTRLRYENMREKYGYGRLVDKTAHDKRYELTIKTLQIVQRAKLYDHIYIYGRAGRQKQKGTKHGLRLISLDGVDPLTDYIHERNKNWSENDLRYFTSDILQLIRQMIWRNATNNELKEIFEIFDLEKVDALLAPDLLKDQ